jgi:hypothetical protein
MNQSLAYEFTQVTPQIALTGVQSGFCTIFVRAQSAGLPVVDSMGQVDTSNGDYTILPGHQNLPCQLAVNKMRPDEGGVIRRAEQYDTKGERTIEFQAYLPLILQQHLAQVDGTFYEVMAAEPDSQKQFTRLAVRLYTL